MRTRVGFALLLLIGMGQLPAANGQDSSRVLKATRMPSPPTIDGSLTAAEWAGAEVADHFTDPATGRQAPDQTRVHIGYDSAAIYLAFECDDADPRSIVAREIRDGAPLGADDTVTFSLDAMGRRASGFSDSYSVNAAGTVYDVIASGRAEKREWRGLWQSKATRTATGWCAEMRIPWSALTIVSPGRACTMTMNLSRYQARTRIESYWSNPTLSPRPEYQGSWTGVVPPTGSRPQLLKYMGYIAPQWASNGDQSDVRMGIDLRYTPSPAMTGILSVRPDFRNIEQAVEGIQFSRSERYLQEARPFFMEGAAYFQSVFYSPRVSGFDLGARVFGTVDKRVDYGVMSLARGARYNVSAGTLSYQFGPNSALGLGGALRRGGAEPDHESAMLNAFVRRGNWAVGGDCSVARESSTQGGAMSLGVSHNSAGLDASIGYTDASPGYRPSLRYVPFVDRRGIEGGGQFRRSFRTGLVRELNCFFGGQRTTHYDGSLFQEGFGAFTWIQTRSDYGVSLGADLGSFNGAHDAVASIGLGGNVSNRFRQWNIGVETGSRDDRPTTTLSLSASRRILGKMDIGYSGTIMRMAGVMEQHVITVGWEFSARRALNGRVVCDRRATNWYAAYRNAGGVGQDLYVIIGDPNARRFDSRVSVKWVWAQ